MIVRPNLYDPQRYHVTVYNRSQASGAEPEATPCRIKASPNPGHCESRDVVALKFAARLGETEIRIYSVDGRWVRTLQAT
ncbi:MAG: hypothetical protein ABIF77_08440, partial [bacterium]